VDGRGYGSKDGYRSRSSPGEYRLEPFSATVIHLPATSQGLLSQTPPPSSVMSEEDRRLNRLTFWSVYFLDVSLSFGVGRETAFRLAAITQTIPDEADFDGSLAESNAVSGSSNTGMTRNVFAYAAKLAYAYGPLVNVVNGPWDNQAEWESQAQQITQQAVEVYNGLPPDMQWSALK
jgi:hypothetical protein